MKADRQADGWSSPCSQHIDYTGPIQRLMPISKLLCYTAAARLQGQPLAVSRPAYCSLAMLRMSVTSSPSSE
jgi:hypothetical protein